MPQANRAHQKNRHPADCYYSIQRAGREPGRDVARICQSDELKSNSAVGFLPLKCLQNEFKKIYRAKTPSTQSKTFTYFSEPWRLCVFARVTGVSDCIVPNGFMNFKICLVRFRVSGVAVNRRAKILAGVAIIFLFAVALGAAVG